MPLVGIVTLIGIGLVVAALAIYLITVAMLLSSVSSKLTKIIDRLWTISSTAEPLGPTISSINRDLETTRQAVHELLSPKLPSGRAAPGARSRTGDADAGERKAARNASGPRRGARKATSSA